MPEQTDTPKPAQPELKFTKSVDFKTFYSNWVQAAFSPFDIALVIGHAVASAQNVFDVDLHARIVFHPAEAKLVAQMLLESVANYETQFGPIGDIANHLVRGPVPQPKTEITEGD